MKRLLLAVFALALLVPVPSQAELSGCGTQIRTAENLLNRLTQDPDGTLKASLEVRPLKRVNIEVAKAKITEAKASLRMESEFECQLNAIAALRALGYNL